MESQPMSDFYPLIKIIDYLEKKGEQKEYDVEEIKEKYLVIDWIACRVCFKRPIKIKQLFIYGEPSTQKTLLLNLLSKVIRIYFASTRINDFAGANDYYDLCATSEVCFYMGNNLISWLSQKQNYISLSTIKLSTLLSIIVVYS